VYGSPNKASMSYRLIFHLRPKTKRALAAERGVKVTFVQANVHARDCPQAAFDVVAEVFAQFSPPPERAKKWRDMRRALTPGGLLIILGYMPKQLQYGTGGPKQLENLYTRPMLEREFGDLRDLMIVEEEREIHEGASHAGMSAVIWLTAIKP
jgi:SAM-dependent methyltransferase